MAKQIVRRSFNLQVNAVVTTPATGTARPDALVYVYSSGGKLLQSQPLDAKGGAVLKLPLGTQPAALRILVGPRVDPAAGLAELLRRGARESHLRVDPASTTASVEFKIAPDTILCWLRSACTVRGTLLKRVVSGGVNLDLPVCNSRVEIFEVDPLWIILRKLPDDILKKLRDIIARPQPIPDPAPGPDPSPFPALTRPISEHVMDADTIAALKAVSADTKLRFLAQTGSALQFQQSLINHAVIVRPLLCYFYPQFVTMQKVGEATTDDCGHFHALFFQGCNNHDAPDLYFKAHQRIFGFLDVIISGPTPVACYTHWDYVCGSEVTLYTTSPYAITCSPCIPVVAPDNWVLFTAIGNYSVHGIFGGGAPGATASNLGLTEGGAPWGGTLRPRLDFDNSLRDTLGITHYEISWRKGTSGNFTPLNAEVDRHYAHFVGSDLVIEPYKLGPIPTLIGTQTHQLYEIPPALPPIGQWTIANAVTDTESGEFDTVQFSKGLSFDGTGAVLPGTADESGLYQLKIELFDAAHNLVDIAARHIRFVVPDTSTLSGVIHTVDASTVAQPSGGSLIVGNAMIITLHIDNNHAFAGVSPPVTPAGSADSCCGVVPYGPASTVSLPYTAYHPHGFATHALNLFRSATQIVPTISGGVGNFTVTKTIADMMTLARPTECLSKPVCTLAAFSEHLEVYATVTDGWGSYLGYNAVADRAFALAPTEVA
ncbi:MAG: hypothetical protein ABI612_11895 [Betaproteobacteria bacterium]